MAQDNGHVSQDDESDGVPAESPEFPERFNQRRNRGTDAAILCNGGL